MISAFSQQDKDFVVDEPMETEQAEFEEDEEMLDIERLKRRLGVQDPIDNPRDKRRRRQQIQAEAALADKAAELEVQAEDDMTGQCRHIQ